MNIVRRVKAWRIRRAKSEPMLWLLRWMKANDRHVWQLLRCRPQNEQRLLKAERNSERLGRCKLPACVVILACLALSACGTVAPKAVEARQASFSQDASTGKVYQDSGIVDSDVKGYHVRPDYYARFLDMEAKYGSFLSPARKAGDVEGITPESPASPFYAQGSRWVFSIPARDRFHELNLRRKSEESP